MRFAARTQGAMGAEITAILAGSPPGVLSVSGGFPNPQTFPSERLDELVAELVRDDPRIALQYAPCEGVRSFREYLMERQDQLQGVHPELEQMMVTSGGMDCIQLVCQAMLDPGDSVAVEAPTYLGALMAFDRFGASIEAIEIDEHGLVVEALAEKLEAGLRPKLLYVIPEYQNPSGRTLPLDRRKALVELCRRHDVLVLEDVAYREMSFDGTSLPSLWSLAPDVVLQAGTFSKIFAPGLRLGWAAGPAALIAQLADAKQTADQCASALGQRMVEEYGRAGLLEAHIPDAQALYAARWRATGAALEHHMPDGCGWSEPTGGFFTWLTFPEGIDTTAMRDAAAEEGVAYVPGRAFYAGGEGANELRFSFSLLGEPELEQAVERIAAVVGRELSRG
jgi:2-aminoadipate transaminase